MKDQRILALVRLMLKAAVIMPDGTKIAVQEGTPQGGPLSPLLSNIVLDELDRELARRCLRFVRYAAILVHASVALVTIGLFLIHVYMSAILEEGSFGSMIHGYVTRAWAWTFHRTWYYEVTGRSRPKQSLQKQ